jgi:hypothetical protein
VNIITGELADTGVSLLSAKAPGLKAIGAFLDGDSDAFTKVKVQIFQSSKKIIKKASGSAVYANAELDIVKQIMTAVDSDQGPRTDILIRVLGHELLPYPPALFEITASGNTVLRTGSKCATMEFLKISLAIEMWLAECSSSRDLGSLGVVVDFMPLIRGQTPRKDEILTDFAKRTLESLIKKNSRKRKFSYIL